MMKQALTTLTAGLCVALVGACASDDSRGVDEIPVRDVILVDDTGFEYPVTVEAIVDRSDRQRYVVTAVETGEQHTVDVEVGAHLIEHLVVEGGFNYSRIELWWDGDQHASTVPHAPIHIVSSNGLEERVGLEELAISPEVKTVLLNARRILGNAHLIGWSETGSELPTEYVGEACRVILWIGGLECNRIATTYQCPDPKCCDVWVAPTDPYPIHACSWQECGCNGPLQHWCAECCGSGCSCPTAG